MRRKLILAVVLAAVLAELAWWLFAPGKPAAAPSTASPAAPVAESTQANVPAPSLAEPERIASTSAPTESETPTKPTTTTVVAAPATAPTATVGEVLVEGMVVDANGVGVAGAALRLMAGFGADGLRSDLWSDAGASAKSNADGSFRVHGSRAAVETRTHAQVPRCGLQARAQGFSASEVVPCRLGEVGLRIVLARAARIEGSVEFVGPLGRRDVEVALEDPRAPRSESGLPVVQVTDGSTFVFENLGEGKWNVVVRTRGRQELARVDGVVAQSGETTRDPRLAPLRVEARGTFAVSVFLPDGSPAASAQVLLVRGSGQHTSSTKLGLTAPGVFLAVDEPGGVTLSIEHEGLRIERLEHVRGPTRVDLKPPLVVEFEFENLPELERDGLALELTLVEVPQPGDGLAAAPIGYSLRWLSNPNPSLKLASPGDFAWVWTAVDSTGATTGRWAEAPAPTVRVLDTTEPQVLRIRAPDGLWERLAAGR